MTRRIRGYLSATVAAEIREHVHPRADHAINLVNLMRTEVGTYRNETNLLLDSLVRELTRLQDQVEILQGVVAEATGSRGEPGLVVRSESDAA